MKDCLSDKVFLNPFPKTAQITNLNQKSGLRFDQKNLTEVWIQQIHDLFLDFSEKKKTQNPFLDLRIRIQIFPQKRSLRQNLSKFNY